MIFLCFANPVLPFLKLRKPFSLWFFIKHSFEGLKSFLKGKKGWLKHKTLNVARFARKVENETFGGISIHCALHSVENEKKKYVTRLWIKREQFRCGDTAEIDK